MKKIIYHFLPKNFAWKININSKFLTKFMIKNFLIVSIINKLKVKMIRKILAFLLQLWSLTTKWLLLVKIKGMKKFKTEDKLKILIISFKFDSRKRSSQIQKMFMTQIYNNKKKIWLKMNILSYLGIIVK